MWESIRGQTFLERLIETETSQIFHCSHTTHIEARESTQVILSPVNVNRGLQIHWRRIKRSSIVSLNNILTFPVKLRLFSSSDFGGELNPGAMPRAGHKASRSLTSSACVDCEYICFGGWIRAERLIQDERCLRLMNLSSTEPLVTGAIKSKLVRPYLHATSSRGGGRLVAADSALWVVQCLALSQVCINVSMLHKQQGLRLF